MSFSDIQGQFVAHLKDPENTSPPADVDYRRVKIYQDLLFNNIVSFISSALPVTHSLYDEGDWLKLTRTFFKKHQSVSPYFIDISKEFITFLSHQYVLQDNDPACLLYLAHYEWIELDVSVDNCAMTGKYYSAGPITRVSLVPSARLVQYPLPVHQITSDFQPSPELDNLHYYLVFRDQSHEVIFKQVSAIIMALLVPLNEGDFVSPSYLVEYLGALIPEMEFNQREHQVRELVDELLLSGALMVDS